MRKNPDILGEEVAEKNRVWREEKVYDIAKGI